MKVCLLSSGSKGNSCLVISNNTKILIDIGTTSTYVINELDKLNIKPEEINAILITHNHVDHIHGLKSFIKKYKTKVYVTEKLLGLLEEEIGSFDYELYQDKQAIIGDLRINTIRTSHDAGEQMGFIIKDNKKSMVYITDTGYINNRYYEDLSNKNLYILESNHDVLMLKNGPYPYFLQQRVLSDKGHLSNDQASNYLCKFIGDNTKTIVLAHLSEKNNTPEKALETLNKHLEENNIKFNNILIGKQNEPTKVIEV
ncbi:MAG: MBL fold metallo-hydrolase [Bacilli bacterium]|nr:MBL fold metallo-hydrolase [Bacilli bacterium]